MGKARREQAHKDDGPVLKVPDGPDIKAKKGVPEDLNPDLEVCGNCIHLAELGQDGYCICSALSAVKKIFIVNWDTPNPLHCPLYENILDEGDDDIEDVDDDLDGAFGYDEEDGEFEVE